MKTEKEIKDYIEALMKDLDMCPAEEYEVHPSYARLSAMIDALNWVVREK